MDHSHLNEQEHAASEHNAQDVQLHKDIAACSYIYVMSVVLYLLKEHESPFVRFHARQGMVLFAASVIVWMIPIIGRFLELFVLIGMVMGFLVAAQGHWTELPVVGPLARGQCDLHTAWRDLQSTITAILHRVRSYAKADAGKQQEKGQQTPLATEGDSSMLSGDDTTHL